MGIQILKHRKKIKNELLIILMGKKFICRGGPHPPLQIHFQGRVTALPTSEKLFLGAGRAATRP